MVVLNSVRWQLIFDLDDVDDAIFGPFLIFVLMQTWDVMSKCLNRNNPNTKLEYGL